MFFEVVKYGLPAGLLDIDRISGSGFKGFEHLVSPLFS